MKTLTTDERLIIEAAAAVDPRFAMTHAYLLNNHKHARSSGSPVNDTGSDPISVWYVVNGQEGEVPLIAAGVVVSAVLWIQNDDSISHTIDVLVQQNTTGDELADTGGSSYQWVLGPGNNMSIQLDTFVMPNSGEALDTAIIVDGVADLNWSGQWPINLLTPVTPLTSISSVLVPAKAVNGSTVQFTAVVTNVSTQSINVQMKGFLNLNTDDISVPISPASFSLASGGSKTISGSFSMLAEAGVTLDIETFINGNEDTFFEVTVAEGQITGNPKLTISNTQISQGGSLAYSGSGFVSNTAVNLEVIDNQGNATSVAMPASDANGYFSGATPPLSFVSGNYTLQATDDVGEVATASFSVIAPATVATSVSPSGSGSVSVLPAGYYKSGQVISLTAKANNGYYFAYWKLPDYTTATDNPHSWVLQGGSNSFTAVFSPTNVPPGQEATLVIPVSPVGSGVVSVSVGAPYSAGDSLTLTANPISGYYFAYWTYNGKQVNTNPIIITLVAGTNTITAVFTKTAPTPPPTPGTSWWDKLTKTQQNLIIGGGAVLVVGGIVTLIVTTGKKSK